MNTQSEFDRRAAAWLADGPTELNDRVLEAALREVHLTPQRRRPAMPWRTPLMSLWRTAGVLIAIVAVAGILAFNVIGGPGGRPTAVPTQTTAGQTVAPRPTSVAVATLDPTTFVTYTSERYGFSIGHPASWSETPSTRAWSFETDSDATAPSSAGAEHITSPNAQVRVSAWLVPLAAGTSIDSREAILAWVSDYCTRTSTRDCGDLQARAAPFCNEHRDCHAAVLVTFGDWVASFATGGHYNGNVLVVAVWRGEEEPEVAPYGGAQSLLTTFLSTMDIVPAVGSEQLAGWPTPSPS